MGKERTDMEIVEQIDEAMTARDEGGRYNGMTYEEGVIAALEWVAGHNNDKPMED